MRKQTIPSRVQFMQKKSNFGAAAYDTVLIFSHALPEGKVGDID
jgi:hypothetical protein